MWWHRPGHLESRQGHLYVGNLSCHELARRYGTPLYVYNLDRVRENYHRLRASLDSHLPGFHSEICYAVKANPTAAILGELRALGAGADVSSPGELCAAVNAGFRPDQIVFTGTSLSTRDLEIATAHEVLINVDAGSRLPGIARLAKNRAIMLRHNPGVGAGRINGLITAAGHGKWPAKFGLSADELLEAAKLASDLGLDIVGLHQHIGSGWLRSRQLDRFFAAVDLTIAVGEKLSTRYALGPLALDLGGGLGVRRRQNSGDFPLAEYASGINLRAHQASFPIQRLIVEPGAFLVEDAGILLVSVTSIDHKSGRWVAGVDAGLNVLNGPAYYEDYHEILPVEKLALRKSREYAIVGNICEPRDAFARRRSLPELQEGDVLALLNAGAYGAVFACHYNGRPTPAEVCVRGDQIVHVKEQREPCRDGHP